jgi:hypothetical protein
MQPIGPDASVLAVLNLLPKEQREALIARYFQAVKAGIASMAFSELERDDILEFERLVTEEHDMKKISDFLSARISDFDQKLDTLLTEISFAFRNEVQQASPRS